MTNLPHSSSVFLVSGGAKGITAQCVIRLAKAYQCRFILLGRSPLAESEPAWAQGVEDEASLKRQIMADMKANNQPPTPKAVQQVCNRILSQREITATLQAIEQAGGRAEYVSVDITDRHNLTEQVNAAISRTGPITGLIHGAGALADKLIEKKSEQDFERVFTTKVAGLENLLACLPPSQLTHLILFSSVAGFYGNVGQTDYAMANEVLNKSAHLLQKYHPTCRVVSINWGPWDGGMVTPELKKAFADRGVAVIPIPVGAKMLVDELAAPDQATQVVIGKGLVSPETPFEPTLRSYRLHRRLSEAANPFLNDHRIGPHAVLPTTCAISWLAHSCEQRYPAYRFLYFEEMRVFKGIVFDETLAEEYILDLQEIAKPSPDEIIFEGKIWSLDPQTGQTRYHYSMKAYLGRRRSELAQQQVHQFVSSLNGSHQSGGDKPIPGSSLYKSKILFHGPAFRGVEQVIRLTEDEITMACYLPRLSARQQGQFPVQSVNPYLTDVLLQGMVVWVGHFRQASSLPLFCQQGQFFRPLPFDERFYISLKVIKVTDLKLTTDITAYDVQGQLYAKLNGSTVTISEQLNRLTGMNL